MSRSLLVLATAIALAGAVACSRTEADFTAGDAGAAAAAAEPASSTASASPVKPLTLTHTSQTVGSEVKVTASGLPAGKTLELGWKTVTGGWVIEDYYHFRGKKYEESTLPLGKFPIDSSGQLEARFQIPEDYGGIHDVVGLVDGTLVTQGGVEVKQSF